jgi:hypothetical protein
VDRDETTFYGRLQKVLDDAKWPDDRTRAGNLSKALAEDASTAVTPDTIRSWEDLKGQYPTKPSDIVFVLADLLRVDPLYLFGFDQYQASRREAADRLRQRAAAEERCDIAGENG